MKIFHFSQKSCVLNSVCIWLICVRYAHSCCIKIQNIELLSQRSIKYIFITHYVCRPLLLCRLNNAICPVDIFLPVRPDNNRLLKSVSKLRAHFVKMANIFRNLNGICISIFAMHSYGHEDNFQPSLVTNWLILRLKKEDEKFTDFRRANLWLKRSIWGESLTFAESKYVFGFVTRPRRRRIIAVNDTQFHVFWKTSKSSYRGSCVMEWFIYYKW